ncbi:MAG: PQQ-dependent sugar dehydrogenase [Dehalococcoidia bacterium]|nr:PQQ-dependent sugar dehydrogenase [Dehalococcoidia bacterium]
MHFGPDGYLYFPLGDGGVVTDGEPGDPDNRAQNPQTYLGKMLRIDVDGILPYEIPITNPFYGAVDTLNEIWAIGLRNPWRFSFDKLSGDMWLPDVGHDFWEEINYEPAGSTGGNNYGWRCYESNAEYNFDSCDAGVDYTFPLFEYPHNDSTGGCSVTGGYVYRGAMFPECRNLFLLRLCHRKFLYL